MTNERASRTLLKVLPSLLAAFLLYSLFFWPSPTLVINESLSVVVY
jgi:hypothetical protein